MSFLCACGGDDKEEHQQFSVDYVREMTKNSAEVDPSVSKKLDDLLKKYDDAEKKIKELEKKQNLDKEEKKKLQQLKESKDEEEKKMKDIHEEEEKKKEKKEKEEKKDKKEHDKKDEKHDDEKGGPIDVKEMWDYGMERYKENVVNAWIGAFVVGCGTGFLGAGAVAAWAGFSNMVMKSDKEKEKFDIKVLMAFASMENIKKWFLPGFIFWLVAVGCCYTWWIFFIPPLAFVLVCAPFVPNIIAFKDSDNFVDAIKRAKDAVFGNIGDLKGAVDSAKDDLESGAKSTVKTIEMADVKDAKGATEGLGSALGTAGDTLEDGKKTIQHIKACVVILIALCSFVLLPAGLIMMHKRYTLTMPGDKIKELDLAKMAGVDGEINALKNATNKI